jgi:MbtH protein
MSEEQSGEFVVVRNEEEQYSIWAIGRPIPLGWKVAGPSGSKDSCLAYIRETWTDLRPRSLRLARPDVTAPSNG